MHWDMSRFWRAGSIRQRQRHQDDHVLCEISRPPAVDHGAENRNFPSAMMSTPREIRSVTSDRRGAIVVLVAVSLVVLMGMLVLAIDAGNFQRQRRMAQTAADAAALAGAIEIFRNRPDSIDQSAKSEAKRNGFEDLVGGDVVTVTYPAASGNFTGDKYVDVVVQRTVPTAFGSFFGQGSAVIHSRATA